MARLPNPGGDAGNWGTILNDFLSVEHETDGTLKADGALADKADNSEVVKLSGSQTISGTKTFSSSPILPDPTADNEAATKSYVDNAAPSEAPDADSNTKGLVQLAGDFSGTAASPQIAAGVVVDANISGTAAIAQSKILDLPSDLANKQPIDADLTDIATLTPTNDDLLQRKEGAWNSRTPAQVKTDLALAKSDVGLDNVDNTSDADKPVSTATQTALDAEASLRQAADLLKLDKAPLSQWPTFIYGQSYSILTAPYFTTGRHYTQLLAAALGGGAVTSYGISAKRILDVLSALINQSPFPGLSTTPVAGSKWPGTSSRNGLIILESSFNDVGHYPTMVGTAIPAAISGTVYRSAMKSAYRVALSLMSSESRIENATFTVSGTWTRGSTQAYASGGLVDFTTAVGAYAEVSVMPPQVGPLAGKVFIHNFTLPTNIGTMAAVNISVDGGTPVAYTPPPWETYTGPTGVAVNVGTDAISVTVPVDGNAHTVRVTHAGSAGHYLYNDFIAIPSEEPNPIVVMGCELGPKAGPLWTTAQVNTFRGNMLALNADIKSVVEEFSNAIYAPSTMTPSGLYSADGVHPNDRGMEQRAADAAAAVQSIKARLDSRVLATSADNTFGII